MDMKLIARLFSSAIPALAVASWAYAASSPEGSLLTPDQQRVDRIALSLLDDPGVSNQQSCRHMP